MIDQIKQFILDIIFPSFCLSCHKEGTVICNTCLGSIKVNGYFYCPTCNRRLADFNKRPACHKTSLNGLMVANIENSNLLHQLIYNYKYKFIRDLSVPLSKILIRYLENISVCDDFRHRCF